MEVAIAKAWTSDAHERACWRAHQVLASAGSTVDQGVLPLYSRRAKAVQLYLGDTPYHLKKVAQQIDNWPALEVPKRKPLGIWEESEYEVMPSWEPWRKRKEDRMKKKEERMKRE
ncbi:hypothetical protein ES703_116661 [subsurface metagenome]